MVRARAVSNLHTGPVTFYPLTAVPDRRTVQHRRSIADPP